MINNVLMLVLETLRSPRETAARVLEFQIDRSSLWLALMLVSIVSVLGSQLTLAFVPDEMVNSQSPLPQSPIVLALVIWGLLVVTVFSTHYIGRAFDGAGTLDKALLATVWLQFVMLVVQVGQLALFVISPLLAVLIGYLVALYVFYVFLNFVLVMHDFKSLGLVFAGAIVSAIGVLFGLSLLLGLIAALFGLEIQTNV
ncbi:Yip1-like protein [Litoreibacter ponti]|uniref:Yip1-like protein n=1 Tax=Litoreibacter ponti TaxID=1510457 RepID=A0A2T6BIF8_9RHOB|nr:Yip1 family protein [Litoreibacter ponti]PTX55850.1 Yip1-like protein [Litoreibacter ponti]